MLELKPEWHAVLLSYAHLFRMLWKKITLVFLTLHGLYGLYLSVKFLLIDYAQLEEALVVHQISRSSVEVVIIEAIVILTATVVEIAIAVRLAQKKSILSETIDVLIGSLLLLFSVQIRAYIAGLELLSQIVK